MMPEFVMFVAFMFVINVALNVEEKFKKRKKRS
jgi:hypothetical protein